MELLRGCHVNRPLSPAEAARLQRVFDLALHAPALRLLCGVLADTASQLAFLHPAPPDAQPPLSAAEAASRADALSMAATEYRLALGRGLCPPASALSPEEEQLALHAPVARPPPPAPARVLRIFTRPVACLGPPPTPRGWVAEVERIVAEQAEDTPAPPPRPFPLATCRVAGGPLGAEMLAELRESWEVHSQLPGAQLRDKAAFAAFLAGGLDDVAGRRADAERWVVAAHAQEPDAGRAQSRAWRAAGLRLRRAAGVAPLPQAADLARALRAPAPVAGADVRPVDSFASASVADSALLREGVITWLELCVLEERLRRLQRMAAARDWVSVVRELRVRRTWDASEHPEWLVFEADEGIQIRPAQYALAHAVLCGSTSNVAPIFQLNSAW